MLLEEMKHIQCIVILSLSTCMWRWTASLQVVLLLLLVVGGVFVSERMRACVLVGGQQQGEWELQNVSLSRPSTCDEAEQELS